VYASDGFVSVTGYQRSEVVPRNCRFLQGNYTDRNATKRLRTSIDAKEEIVELLLNYKKNGEPFWNLLYVGKQFHIRWSTHRCRSLHTAPLYDANGRLEFYIGGQINCSTTIRSNTDVLRILSMSDDPEDDKEATASVHSQRREKRSFFGFGRKGSSPKLPQSTKNVEVKDAGMEPALLKQIENMNFRTQMELFYTTYSKVTLLPPLSPALSTERVLQYLVIKYETFVIQHYSPGIVEILGTTNRTATDVVGNDVFKFFAQHTLNLPREYKSKVRQSLKQGQAISASINIFTPRSLKMRNEEKFFTHWTPTKDEHGNVKYVVVTLSSSLYS